MIQVLKATEEQYNFLNGLVKGSNKLEFIKDADDHWIVGKQVLNDPAWESIKAELLELEEIDFNPIVVEL